MKETFIYNCNPSISRALLGCDKMHFKDLVKRAKAIEEHDKHVSRYEIVEAINEEKRSNVLKEEKEPEIAAPITNIAKIKCYNCGEYGHISRNCAKPVTKPKERMRVDKCAACGNLQHKLIECEQMKELIRSLVGSKLNDGKPKEVKTKWCSHCKLNNHMTNDCRKLNKIKSRSNQDRKRSN